MLFILFGMPRSERKPAHGRAHKQTTDRSSRLSSQSTGWSVLSVQSRDPPDRIGAHVRVWFGAALSSSRAVIQAAIHLASG